MKKLIAIILTIAILIPCTVIAVDKGLFAVPEKKVTYEQAHQFADELKAMTGNTDYRLIVSADKEIEYMNAVSVAEGIEGLYVLQYNSLADAQEAEAYYNSLSYVNSVEYDSDVASLCEVKTSEAYTFTPKCTGTAATNIDDAIKLLGQEGYDFPEMKVGIIDTGVALNPITQKRFVGGYSYIDGYAEDGTDDVYYHGTMVAGTIILNTFDNVKISSYQIIGENGFGTIANTTSAIYLAVSEGCDLINCSFGISATKPTNLINAVNYATNCGTLVICAACNDSVEVENTKKYPALIDSAITVGATTEKGYIATFSNYGKLVDIFATGTMMLGLTKTGQWQQDSFRGTSAASPLVASICALLRTVNPSLTRDEIVELLQNTGSTVINERINYDNYVIADAYEAVCKLTNSSIERTELDYSVYKNGNSNCTDFSFTSEENASIYYRLSLGSTYFFKPYRDYNIDLDYKYNNNSTVSLNGYKIVNACAYAPGKAKSKPQVFIAPIYNYDNGFLINDGVISRCQLNDEVIEIPEYIDDEQITEIGAYCFMGNKNIKTVILPDSVTRIDACAFANCPNLQNVIAHGVEYTELCAFYDCANLKTVELPNLKIANTAIFKNCCSLSNLEIGTLDTICNQAFYCCEGLRFLDVSDKVTSFCDNTFENCNSLIVKVVEGSFMESYANEHNIPIGEVEIIPECTHDNLVVISELEATCTERGYKIYECADCGYTFTEYNESYGHIYTVTIKEPTCSTRGFTKYTCKYCGISYLTDLNYNYKPHDWDITVKQEATIMVPGKANYCCWNCGYRESRYIPALYDFNEDLYINARDFALMMQTVKGYYTDPNPEHNYDINNDGKVDEADLEQFRNDFQEHYSEFLEFYKSDLFKE